jgi:hypothetical protein
VNSSPFKGEVRRGMGYVPELNTAYMPLSRFVEHTAFAKGLIRNRLSIRISYKIEAISLR